MDPHARAGLSVLAGVTLAAASASGALGAACQKADAPSPGLGARELPVTAVSSVAALASTPASAPMSASGVLPPMSLATSSEEDTAAEIADIAGDDPSSPRCTGMRLELTTKKDTQGDTAFVATIINGGTKPVMLVEPGDGSDVGWRTPVITWKVTTLAGANVPRPRHARCGNVDGLDEKDVFTLKPGARHVLAGWLGQPSSPGGRYSVRLVYDNDPSRKQQGVAFSPPTAAALALVKKTTVCRVESNAVIADITPF